MTKLAYPAIIDRTDIPAVFRSLRCPRPNYALTGTSLPCELPTDKRLQELRAELRAKGVNLHTLCKEKGVSYQAARDLLRGRAKGYRGDAHKAAVALGLKPDPDQLAA